MVPSYKVLCENCLIVPVVVFAWIYCSGGGGGGGDDSHDDSHDHDHAEDHNHNHDNTIDSLDPSNGEPEGKDNDQETGGGSWFPVAKRQSNRASLIPT